MVRVLRPLGSSRKACAGSRGARSFGSFGFSVRRDHILIPQDHQALEPRHRDRGAGGLPEENAVTDLDLVPAERAVPKRAPAADADHGSVQVLDVPGPRDADAGGGTPRALVGLVT